MTINQLTLDATVRAVVDQHLVADHHSPETGTLRLVIVTRRAAQHHATPGDRVLIVGFLGPALDGIVSVVAESITPLTGVLEQ